MVALGRVRAVKSAAGRPRAPRTRVRSRLRSLGRGLRRAGRALLAAPLAVRIVVFAVMLVIVWSAVNWTYQVIRKPSELFFPVSGTLTKAPAETWLSSAPPLRRDATPIVTPELLAARAQAHGAAGPAAPRCW